MSAQIPSKDDAARGASSIARGAGPDAGGVPAWRLAIRDVVLVAVLVVGAVLGAVVLTGVLPPEGQRLIFHTPLAILGLLVVTGWVLWRSARRRPPQG